LTSSYEQLFPLKAIRSSSRLVGLSKKIQHQSQVRKPYSFTHVPPMIIFPLFIVLILFIGYFIYE